MKVSAELQNQFAVPTGDGAQEAQTYGAALSSCTGVSLRPWDNAFEDQLLRWRNDPRLAFTFWRGESKPLTWHELQPELDAIFAGGIFFLIVREAHRDALGFVHATRAVTHFNGTIFLEGRYRGRGAGVVAAGLFFRYLFENFNVPKIAFEVCEWDQLTLKVAQHHQQVRLEGIRRNRVLWEGRLCHVYEFALGRREFVELTKTKLWQRVMGCSE